MQTLDNTKVLINWTLCSLYKKQTNHPHETARPFALITTLGTRKPVEFKTQGLFHHFNLQLVVILETYRITGNREHRHLIVPGHASLYCATEELNVGAASPTFAGLAHPYAGPVAAECT